MTRAVRIALPTLLSMFVAFGGHNEGIGAETTEAGLKAHLTGGDERAWVKSRWEPVLAAPSEEAPQCVQGELWIFGQDEKGIKRTCENGFAHESEFDWAWVGVMHDLPILMVDKKEYVIELRQKRAELEGEAPVLVTILRSLRIRQIDPVEEITLEFWER